MLHHWGDVASDFLPMVQKEEASLLLMKTNLKLITNGNYYMSSGGEGGVESTVEELTNLATQIDDLQCELDETLTGIQDLLLQHLKKSPFHRLFSIIYDAWWGKQLEAITRRRRDLKLKLDKFSVNYRLLEFEERVPIHNYNDDSCVYGPMQEKVNEMMEYLKSAGEYVIAAALIVGIGGIGKTTLARMCYKSYSKNFDCCIWVNVSKSTGAGEGGMVRRDLIDILQQSNRSNIVIKGDGGINQLLNAITISLRGKSVLLVLDDVSNNFAIWKTIQPMLPQKSRVIMTTRSEALDQKMIPECHHVVRLQPLSHDDAWSLFCKKASPMILIPHQRDIGDEIMKRCCGVPLAIVIIGSLISTKKAEEWSGVLELFDSQLRIRSSTSSNADTVAAAISTAYIDLPLWLKTCFLYLSIFQEDHDIPVKKLCSLWMAQGFLPDHNNSEQTALQLLLQRNLIQKGRMGTNREVQTCRLHDYVRDFVARTSLRTNFCSFNNKGATPKSPRHLSLPAHIAASSTFTSSMELKKTRTLLFMADESHHDADPSRLTKLLEKLLSLRALDLESVKLETLPDEAIHSLAHLRCLNLRGTNIRKLPRSLGRLKNLESLDMRGTRVLEMPSSLFRLSKLRHLHLTSCYGDKVVALPDDFEFSSLLYLQTLSGVKITLKVAQWLVKLTQLQKLAGSLSSEEVSPILWKSIGKLTLLKSLSLKSRLEFNLEIPTRQLATLFKIRLGGPIENLSQLAAATSLTYLYLWDSKLKQDPLQALQHLPNLVHLSLCNAFHGYIVRCDPGGFPKLKKLSLVEFRNLEIWESINSRAMCNLEELFIGYCPKLKKLPEGLGSLQVLKLVETPLASEWEEKQKFRAFRIPEFLNSESDIVK